MLSTPTFSYKRRRNLQFLGRKYAYLHNLHCALVLIVLLGFTGATWAQISVPNSSFTYTENFNTLPISGTGHTAVPAGWAFFETTSFGVFANTTYRAGDASGEFFQVTYDTYSFGATGDSDRAFGSVPSVYEDSLNTTIGVCFTNNTGSTITSMTVTYTGETWRVSSPNRQDGLVFQYNQNTTAINGAGTWTAFTALDYFNPGSPTIGGGSIRHSAVFSATISGLNIAPGNTFCFRWLNFNATAAPGGNPNQEDALGVDDFSLSNIVVCTPPVVTAPTVTQPTCGAPSGGAITVNATGTGTLEYSINNGGTWDTNPVFNGLAAGNYHIKVRQQANPSCETTYGSNPVVLSSPFTASTTSDTWTGCISTDWATPGNWADGSVPTAVDNVTIPNVANDPVIMGGTAALARSVVVEPGALLTVDGTSSLTINGSINVYGILNAIYSEGTVQNNGQIIIGTSPNIGNYGIWNLGIFNNNGTISIDNVNSIGLYLYGGTFTNAGDIFIGSTALSAQDCIQNNNGGSLINTSTGEITLNRAWGSAIWNSSGNVQNSGKINIGSIASTGTGILSYVPFTNNAGAEIHIDRVGNGIVSANAFTNTGLIRMGENAPLTGSGIANVQGAATVFNNNVGGDISIKQTAVDGVQNDATSTFNNNACATLTVFDNLNNTGTFTNAGLMTFNTTQAHTNSALTNTGIIAYPQGNPIPNVTNNEIIIAPTTANTCDAISPAFGLGSPVDFTIVGVFTNTAATLSAGTYVTATNTFTPTTVLPEGVRTYYVKVMDGSGGCTRIIPWQLTTENCCDAPQAICKTATIALVGNSASLAVSDVNNGSTADCGLQTITVLPNSFNCSHVGTPQTVTLTITDVKGISASCQTTVMVQDNTPPSITCPGTQTLVLGANCTATLPNYTTLATTGDNCGVQGVTQSPAAGTPVSGAGNMTVTLTVTDVNGLTDFCQFTVTKMDETPPTVVCKNTTVFVNATGTYTLLATDVFNATASSDNCSGELTVTNISPATVSCNQVNQTIPVTVTVQDAAGNTASCTAQITVEEGAVLPEGWSSNNVGNANGSSGYKTCSTNGQFTVSATGFSTSSADVLHLVSRQLCGNGEIIARVANVAGGGWAGITLRETLAPGSKKVALKTQSNGNIRREIRTVTNGAVNNLNYFRPGHTWLRLVRNGSVFTGYTSANGTTWNFAFSATISMAGCIYAGVFAESINSNVTTTGTFDNVQIIGGTSLLIQASQTPAAPSTFSPQVYPNPTTGEVNVDLSAYANPIGTVKVFDAYGKLVLQKQLDGSLLFRINLDGDDGVYFLSIEVEGEAPVTKRVVIAH